MIIGTLKGKALLVIERSAFSKDHFDVNAHVQSAEGTYQWRSAAQEDLECGYRADMLPGVCKRMKIGERVWISIVYIITYTQDYWGEYDCEVVYRKERTLKRTRSNNDRHK